MNPDYLPGADNSQPVSLARAEQTEARDSITRAQMRAVAHNQAILADMRAIVANKCRDEDAEERHAQAALRFLMIYLELSYPPAACPSCGSCGQDNSAMWGE